MSCSQGRGRGLRNRVSTVRSGSLVTGCLSNCSCKGTTTICAAINGAHARGKERLSSGCGKSNRFRLRFEFPVAVAPIDLRSCSNRIVVVVSSWLSQTRLNRIRLDAFRLYSLTEVQLPARRATTLRVVRKSREIVNALAFAATSNVVSTTFRSADISLKQQPSIDEGLGYSCRC